MNRDTAIVIALALIALASGFASFRAWAMLFQDRRQRREDDPGSPSSQAPTRNRFGF